MIPHDIRCFHMSLFAARKEGLIGATNGDFIYTQRLLDEKL